MMYVVHKVLSPISSKGQPTIGSGHNIAECCVCFIENHGANTSYILYRVYIDQI